MFWWTKDGIYTIRNASSFSHFMHLYNFKNIFHFFLKSLIWNCFGKGIQHVIYFSNSPICISWSDTMWWVCMKLCNFLRARKFPWWFSDSNFECMPHRIWNRYVICIYTRGRGETCCVGYKWDPILKNCTSEYFFSVIVLSAYIWLFFLKLKT